MDKLKPAGAFHKDSIDTRKSFSNNDERDISVELEFMRSINRTSTEGSFTKHKSFHEDESENTQSMLDLRDDSFMKIDQDTVCLDGGKLVYDEELIRLGYIRDPLQKHGKSYIDDDASIESCNDIIDITQANVHRIQKQESRTKLDHRLEFSKGLHCGDETIQKRLQRAMQSDDEQHLHLEFVNNESDAQDGMLLANQESSSPQCDDNIVTMVKEFSMEDFSDESFSKSSIEQQSFIVNDEDSIKESNQHTRRGLKSPSTMESYKLDDKANSTGKGIDSNSSVLHKNRRYSFDSDCSFLPDHDFATSNWDSD
jgi:Uri superfamily endonuclease